MTSSAGRLAAADDPPAAHATPAAEGDLPLASADVVDALAARIRDRTSAAAAGIVTEGDPGDACYWDTRTMAPLNARSAAAIARLRAFRAPPFPAWDRLPLSRRAAVLVLLYADRRGDLRVVLTMRAASLRNYSGHAAFPGGKADALDETPRQIARREAWEEIGLPLDDAQLPRPFCIEHLCELPHNLAKTELVVRPCIALLHAGEGSASSSSTSSSSTSTNPDEALIPRLDAKEVAAVFSAPFHNFLLDTDEVVEDGAQAREEGEAGAGAAASSLPPGPWYEGSWIHWHAKPWRMHFFYVPIVGQRVAKPRTSSAAAAAAAVADSKEDEQTDAGADAGAASGARTDDDDDDETEAPSSRYKVWGMTARILVDAATLAYGEAPAFEHNAHFGDERVIEGLVKMDRLGEKKKPGSVLTHADLKEASKM